MKQLFTYILLFAFAIRPVFFVGQIVYYELNIDAITEKYCENKEMPELKCNGKCHLAKQLQAIVSENSDEDSEENSSFVIEVFTPLYHQKSEEIALHKKAIQLIKDKLFYYSNNYKYNRVNPLLKPPIS